MIHTRALTRRFGAVTAVDGLDLEIGHHGIVGFLGPNGAGKTTTMRMLTGALPQTSGTATVCGYDVFDAPLEVKSRVGYLPETPPLFDPLTVGEYLRYVAALRRVESHQILNRVGDVMERTGLKGTERRLIGTLSKGFRQRLGLAQALVHEPQLVILDEPTAGLDPGQLAGLRMLIRELAASRLVILSTHVLSEVESLCDRIVLMRTGSLIADGNLPQLSKQAGLNAWLELVLTRDQGDLCDRLQALGPVDRVMRIGSETYRLEGPDDCASAVLRLAVDNQWSVRALERRTPSLTQVFERLVGTVP